MQLTDITPFLNQIGFAKTLAEVTPLAGQASSRAYYRLRFTDNSLAVLMQMPLDSKPDEITSGKAPEELPFLNVYRYLKSLHLPVATVYGYAPELGLMLLEDLGDESLEMAVTNKSEAELIKIYEQAIDLLIELQTKTSKKNSQKITDDCIAFGRRFDATLLNWEFEHFWEFGLVDRLQKKLSETEHELFTQKTREITEKIIKMPFGFTHRDFQSRNLHFKNDSLHKLYMIDFQDALQGPVIYDLVALLRDSYIDFSPTVIDHLLKYYATHVPNTHPYFQKLELVKRDFYLQTLQRKLKDTGRFQFIKTVRKNPKFLVHVPLSLRYVREAFEALPEYRDLFKVLQKHLPEFK